MATFIFLRFMVNKSEHQIISVVTRSLIVYLEEKGINANELLEKHHLNRDDVINSSKPVSANSVVALWNEARAILGEPLLHLILGKQLRPGSYRALEYLILSSETLGIGLENLARFIRTINSFLDFKTEVRDDEVALIMSSNDASYPLDPFWVEVSFMTIYSSAMNKIEGKLEVKRICMKHKEACDIAEYEKLYGTKVKFSQNRNAIVITKEAWDTRMQFADKKLFDSLTEHLSGLMVEINNGESPLLKKIQQYFMQRMPEVEPKIEDLAHHLGVSVRNLQRQIKEEGSTFSGLLDETKEKLAIRYLQDDQLSLTDISFLLGFSDQSTFQRAFRRWRGKSPGAFRKEDIN